jgi:hypothetical protein
MIELGKDISVGYILRKGGAGSGNFDHAGRPGLVGGSKVAGGEHYYVSEPTAIFAADKIIHRSLTEGILPKYQGEIWRLLGKATLTPRSNRILLTEDYDAAMSAAKRASLYKVGGAFARAAVTGAVLGGWIGPTGLIIAGAALVGDMLVAKVPVVYRVRATGERLEPMETLGSKSSLWYSKKGQILPDSIEAYTYLDKKWRFSPEGKKSVSDYMYVPMVIEIQLPKDKLKEKE